jgi:hypothetical protein
VCDGIGENDPAVRELLAMLAGIARGDPHLRGRHVGDKFRAIRELLDRRMGKAVQPIDHSGKIGLTLEQLLAGKTDAPPDSKG